VPILLGFLSGSLSGFAGHHVTGVNITRQRSTEPSHRGVPAMQALQGLRAIAAAKSQVLLRSLWEAFKWRAYQAHSIANLTQSASN
jgi:hypothetical protein